MNTNRRNFLALLGKATAAGLLGTITEFDFAPSGQANHSYQVLPWTGDNFTRGHQLRNGELPKFPDQADTTVDFVIVGGGISGLTTAYYLRHTNFLLLEQYDELGGHAIGRTYRGIDYALGSASIRSIDSVFGQLYDELSLQPLALPGVRNSWYDAHKGTKEDLAIGKQFDSLLKTWQQSLNTVSLDHLASRFSQAALKLDAMPFQSCLTGSGESFYEAIDSLVKTVYAASAKQVSALAGLMAVQGLTKSNHVFKGGNSAITHALITKTKPAKRALTGTFVWNIELNDNGAAVVFSMKDGTMRKVNCKQVIVAIPPLVASRIISNLNDVTRASLLACHYGSYLVANFCMPKPAFDGSYSHWFSSPYAFTDVQKAPYQKSSDSSKNNASVLTMYCPYPSDSGGRERLLVAEREDIASNLVKQFSNIVPEFERNLEQVCLTRWGHAMVVPVPGSFARLNRLRTQDNGALLLAHNSMQGLPSVESAILAARHAADIALK